MLKSAVARLFLLLRLLFQCSNKNPSSSRSGRSSIFRRLVIFCAKFLPSSYPVQIGGLLLFIIAVLPQCSCSSKVQSEPRSFDAEPCQTNIPGDCNPYSCLGTCEGRYARFWDSRLKIDRTVKSCQCVQEPICSLIGMSAYAGCRTYNMLSAEAQRSIRLWTMTEAEKSRNHRQHGALVSFRPNHYWDRLRHQQLLNSNSRFCCWTATPAAGSSSRIVRLLLAVFMPVLIALPL